jgi:hypothetical protein
MRANAHARILSRAIYLPANQSSIRKVSVPNIEHRAEMMEIIRRIYLDDVKRRVSERVEVRSAARAN